MNDNFPKFYRTTREKLADPDTFWDAVYEEPDFRETMRKEILDDLTSGDTERMTWIDIPITRKGESTTYITARNIPIPNQPLMISTIWDVTERKMTEDKLSASEIRYRSLFEAAKDGILILNAETGVVVDVNPFLIKLLGFSHEDFIGKNIWELGFFKDIAANQANLLELQQEEYIRYEDLPLETSDGRKFHVEFTSNVYHTNHNRVIQCNIRDISERKLAQEQLLKTLEELKRSNTELEQFAYIASHDLQEPLRAVAGMVQLLQKRYQGQLDERADEYTNLAIDGATRMQTLITDLLTYSRVERRNNPMQPIDANKSLASALRNLQTAIAENSATVTSDTLPTLEADASQLTQLFQNLIGNAIKFHGEHPTLVHVGIEKMEDVWHFSVRDNGIGIDPQYFERIFLIFQRLHTRREYSGTGIGLAICRKIVERHGGRIWIDSQPGQGTTFHFTIPVKTSLQEPIKHEGQ
jgi:PAS domain S-box-containing protein